MLKEMYPRLMESDSSTNLPALCSRQGSLAELTMFADVVDLLKSCRSLNVAVDSGKFGHIYSFLRCRQRMACLFRLWLMSVVNITGSVIASKARTVDAAPYDMIDRVP